MVETARKHIREAVQGFVKFYPENCTRSLAGRSERLVLGGLGAVVRCVRSFGARG